MRHLVVIIVSGLFLWISCKDQELIDHNNTLKKQVQELKEEMKMNQENIRNIQFLEEQLKGVKARIHTNYGAIELQFFPEKAPLHCFNFIARAESGFYDNTKFHRVIPGFMIQGGDPNTRNGNPDTYGMGGPIISIPHEFNDMPHTRGVLSMARPGNKAVGAGSQFFIMHADAPNLDGEYTVFGRVTNGMDVVDKIAGVPKDGSMPVKPVTIKSVDIYR